MRTVSYIFGLPSSFCFVLHRAPGYRYTRPLTRAQGRGGRLYYTAFAVYTYALGYLVITLPQPLAMKPRDEDGVFNKIVTGEFTRRCRHADTAFVRSQQHAERTRDDSRAGSRTSATVKPDATLIRLQRSGKNGAAPPATRE